MKTNSRFTRVAVTSGIIVASGAAVLGITGFASAELAGRNDSAAVIVPAAGNAIGDGTTDASGLGTLQAEGTVSAESTGPVTWTIGETPGRPQFMAAAAEVLGMSESDLIKELLAGKSIKQVAETKNVDLDKVVTALTAALKTHLDAEVAAGEHTQAEADAKLAGFATRVTEMINRPGLPQGGGRDGKGMGGHGAPGFATDALAKVLKLTVADLNTQLQSGKTLADIAKAQNVDIADVKAQLLKDFTEKEQAEVASGEHTQAEVDAKIAEFKTRLDDMVNGVRPAGGPGMGGRGGHGPGGRGHHGDVDGMPGDAPGAGSAQGAGFSA